MPKVNDARPAWTGRHVLVTAGGTREAIDPVRFLGNRSSGRMGNALAFAALARGAEVTLITAAPAPQPSPAAMKVVLVENAVEMRAAVEAEFSTADILLMAAAVADYRVANYSGQKLKKREGGLVLKLVPTEDILLALRQHPRRSQVLVVGFAAETEELLANAADKLQRKGMDLVVANDVSAADRGIGSPYNAGVILDAGGVVRELPHQTKEAMAAQILDILEARLPAPCM